MVINYKVGDMVRERSTGNILHVVHYKEACQNAVMGTNEEQKFLIAVQSLNEPENGCWIYNKFQYGSYEPIIKKSRAPTWL